MIDFVFVVQMFDIVYIYILQKAAFSYYRLYISQTSCYSFFLQLLIVSSTIVGKEKEHAK